MSNINHNYARLLEAMEFTPEKWEVVGVQETNTAPKCSCGHDIVYNYPMRHKETGKVIPIGSVCIEHAPFIPTHLVAQYKEVIKRIKAEKRAAELARREAIKGEIEWRFNENIKTFKELFRNWRPIAEKMFDNRNDQWDFYRDLSYLNWNNVKLRKKKLKTARGWIKVYTKAIDDMQKINDKYKLAMILYSSNVEVKNDSIAS